MKCSLTRDKFTKHETINNHEKKVVMFEMFVVVWDESC